MMMAKRITTSRVPITRTLRATPGVEPARASVVVSRTGGSSLRVWTILLSLRNRSSIGQRADGNRVPTTGKSGRGHRRRVEKQGLGDRRFHGRALERLGDEERRLRARPRQPGVRGGGGEETR